MAEAADVTAKGRASARAWRSWARLGVIAMGAALLCGTLMPAVARGQADDDDDHDSESHASAPEDRVAMFSSIVVTREHPAADVACMFCTVQIDGAVHGDVAVMFGTVNVSQEQTISGDVAALLSTLNVGEGSRIEGDLGTAFSTVRMAPGAHVRGDRRIMASGLGLMVLFGPLLIVIGVVWLLVWGLRRVFLYA